MSEFASPQVGNVAKRNDQIVRFTGGTGAVTKDEGLGIAVTYVSTGVVDLVWAESAGKYIGILGFGFDATTQADLKGYTVVGGAFNATTRTLRLNITDASNALADLTSTQHLSLTVGFKRLNV